MQDPEDPIETAARSLFGVRYLYPYQHLVIANILDAAAPGQHSEIERDCRAAEEGTSETDRLRQIVLLPTGYGKSLCFQLPAAMIPGITLVIYPLRSLMADQERRMRERGLSCTVLKGGMDETDRDRAFESIRSGKSRMVLGNPEILRTDAVLSLLRVVGVVHAVVDEAHCVAEWGDAFRPAYEDLGDILRAIRPRVATAFTATASPRILERIAEVLFGDDPYRVVSGNPDRPNIRYSCVPTLSRSHTIERLSRELPKPLLIFCASRSGTEIVAEMLRDRLGLEEVRFYHAGMTKPERSAVESWFLPSDGGILTATCAFGMGIDKPDIRTVLHANCPPSVESYLQESGRAGRDGNPARAVLLTHPDDEKRWARLPDALHRDRMKSVLKYGADDSRCRRERLLGFLGAPLESCAGCDVCEGTVVRKPEGCAEVLRFISANNGRFRPSEAVRHLEGRDGPCAFGGILAGWDALDIRELISILADRGDISIPNRGLWRGRILKRAAASRVLGKQSAFSTPC